MTRLLLVELPQHEAMDDLGTKAAALEKTSAPGAFLARRWGSAVLALQDGAGGFELARGRHSLDQMLFHALRLELVADARRAVFARKDVRALLGEALVGELLLLLQLVEQGLHLPRAFRVRGELALELGARVLAPGEQPQRPGFKRRRAFSWGAAQPSCLPPCPRRPWRQAQRRRPSRGYAPRSRAPAPGSPSGSRASCPCPGR